MHVVALAMFREVISRYDKVALFSINNGKGKGNIMTLAARCAIIKYLMYNKLIMWICFGLRKGINTDRSIDVVKIECVILHILSLLKRLS